MQYWSELTLGEKLVAVGGVILLIATFLPWYSYSYSGFGVAGGASWSLWSASGFLAFLVLLGCVVAVGIIALRMFEVFDVSEQGVPEPLVVLGAAALAVVITVIKFLSVPGGASFEGFGASASAGRSWGAYLALVFAVVLIVGAVMKFQEDRA